MLAQPSTDEISNKKSERQVAVCRIIKTLENDENFQGVIVTVRWVTCKKQNIAGYTLVFRLPIGK